MGTAEKLLYLQDTKSAIKDAIVAKGVAVPIGTAFRDYADKIGDITSGSTPTADTYVRPTEWLALPDNIDGVQKVSILNAVFDTDSEFVALICTGAYTVDWGDGIVENFASNVTAEHRYIYSDVDLNSDTVSKFGYKQCVITITPQVSQNLTSINLNTFHSTVGNSSAYDLTSGFLDIRINGLNCTSLIIGTSTDYVRHTMLEQCLIGELSNTTLSYLFSFCIRLQSINFKNTSQVTDFSYMFFNCYSLRKISQFDYVSAINLSSMFSLCRSLINIPNFNTTNALLNIGSMFNSCSSIRYGASFDNLTNVTNVSSMYSSCSSLVSTPSYAFPSVTSTNLASMFANCLSLQFVPSIAFNTTVTGNTNTLAQNYSLKRMLMPLRFTFSVANAKMSATALNEMYTALPTVTGQTVTVSGNYGVASDNPTIATAKGWTVVG